MKRIALTRSFLSPSVEDFESYGARILLSRTLIMYVLDDSNKVMMTHHHQIDEIASCSNLKLQLAESLCQVIANISEDAWEVINQKLGLERD